MNSALQIAKPKTKQEPWFLSFPSLHSQIQQFYKFCTNFLFIQLSNFYSLVWALLQILSHNNGVIPSSFIDILLYGKNFSSSYTFSVIHMVVFCSHWIYFGWYPSGRLTNFLYLNSVVFKNNCTIISYFLKAAQWHIECLCTLYPDFSISLSCRHNVCYTRL